MPASILGLTLTFGTPTLTGMVVESLEVTQSFDEEVPVRNEQGDYVAVALASKLSTMKISGTLNGGTFALASVVNIASPVTLGSFYIVENTRTRTNAGFEKIDLTLKNWGF